MLKNKRLQMENDIHNLLIYDVLHTNLPLQRTSCFSDYKIQETLPGEWKNRMFRACNSRKKVCNYIAKVVTIKTEADEKDFLNEVFISQVAADTKISPNVADAFICRNWGILITDEVPYSFGSWLLKLMSFHVKNYAAVNGILDSLLVMLTMHLDKLHEQHIFHRDIKSQNIRFKQVPTKTSPEINFYFIDWGEGIKNTPASKVYKEKDDKQIKDVIRYAKMWAKSLMAEETIPEFITGDILDSGISDPLREWIPTTRQWQVLKPLNSA